MREKPPKNRCEKKIAKKSDEARSGTSPEVPKDIQINKIKNKLTEEKQKIGEPRRILTRPGRLRVRSGSKLPEANVPLRAFGGWVTKDYLLPV